MSKSQQLRYTADITSQDIDAIEAFLTARTDQQTAAHPPGSAEHRTARALAVMVDDAVLDARWALKKLADPAETEVFGGELSLLHEIKNAWNRLVGAALTWRAEPGYDAARWRRVTRTDASYETAAERELARLRAEREPTADTGR